MLHYIVLAPDPFRPCARIQKGGGEKGRKGSGTPSRPSTVNGRIVGAVRMECNYMMCSSDMQGATSPAIEKAVRYAWDIISGISSLKENQVEVITVLTRERFVCLQAICSMHSYC